MPPRRLAFRFAVGPDTGSGEGGGAVAAAVTDIADQLTLTDLAKTNVNGGGSDLGTAARRNLGPMAAPVPWRLNGDSRGGSTGTIVVLGRATDP